MVAIGRNSHSVTRGAFILSGMARMSPWFFRDQTEEHQHLRDAGAGHALPVRDVSLAGNLAEIDLPPPLDGLMERLDHGWFWQSLWIFAK